MLGVNVLFQFLGCKLSGKGTGNRRFRFNSVMLLFLSQYAAD